MKLSSSIYQSLLSIYRILPLQSFWAQILRALPLNLDRFYKDLHFKGVFTTKTMNGSFKLHHTGATIENEVFWKGLNHGKEKTSYQLWQHFSKDASCVLDIGANSGLYSIIAKTQNPHSKVIAFEPSVKLFPCLEANLMLNDLDVTTEKKAITNSNGSLTFYDFPNIAYPSSGSLEWDMVKIQLHDKANSIQYEVECTTLDDYIETNSIERIDLMKIDVEMHEAEVFEGFTRLQEFRPIIIVEILRNKIAERISATSDLEGYRFFRLFGPEQIQEVEKLSIDSEHGNLLLLPKEIPMPDINLK